MALAQPKIDDLEDQRVEITRTFVRSFQLDSVGCMRLERALRQLSKLPEFEAQARHSIGLVLAMKRDYAGVVHNFGRAAALCGDPAVAAGRVTAALHCGMIEEAARHLKTQPLTADPVGLREIMTGAMQSGLYNLAERCLFELQKLNADPADGAGLVSECISDIRTATALMAQWDVTDDDILARVAVAYEVVRRLVPSHPFVVYGFSATPDAGIMYEFPLRLAIDDLVDIDWQISEALIESFEDPFSELIGFSTRPFSSSLRCAS